MILTAPVSWIGCVGRYDCLHYSRRTEEAYIHWTKRFIYFNGKRHPFEFGEPAVTAFLNHLATDRNVAAATQNQALSALLFLYKEALGVELDWLDGTGKSKASATDAGRIDEE